MDRQSTGFGPATLTSGSILEWARGKGYYPMRPFDFDALRMLNRVWMSCWAELNPPPESKE